MMKNDAGVADSAPKTKLFNYLCIRQASWYHFTSTSQRISHSFKD